MGRVLAHALKKGLNLKICNSAESSWSGSTAPFTVDMLSSPRHVSLTLLRLCGSAMAGHVKDPSIRRRLTQEIRCPLTRKTLRTPLRRIDSELQQLATPKIAFV